MIKNDKKNSDNYCQLILGTTPLFCLLYTSDAADE